jgi:DNA-binding transcriptional LysR family regulator
VRESRAVLDQAARLARLGDRNAPVSGEVALGCFTDLAPYHVPGLLKRFGALAPGVTVGFRDGGFDALAAQLESGLIDLALTYDLGLSGKIARMTLVKLAPYAMLPTGHPLILTDQALSWQHVLEIFQRAGTDVDVVARASTFELQRSMVANGFGVAVAYTRPIGDRSYDGKSLVIRPISDPVPDQRILLAWSKQTQLSPGALAFRDFAKSSFAGP